MKPRWTLLVCLLAGCSTHPMADVYDHFLPARLGRNEVQPYGGVCIPQGPIQPPLPSPVILGPDTTPLPAPPGIVPPPAPLPGPPPNAAPPIAVPPPPASFPGR